MLRLVALCLLSYTVSDTYAMCSTLSTDLDEARIQLARAAVENDFDYARTYANRAQGALDDLASSALDCRCEQAQSQFDGSSARTRKARDAASAREFTEQVNGAVKDFNAGINALRTCAAQGTLKPSSQ